MNDCVFCDLDKIKGVHYRTEDVVMFEPLNPVTPGHLLFVHTAHTKHAGSSPHVTAEVFKQAARYARDHREPFNLITSAGKEATQTVFHLHVHYIPRRENDGLKLPWTGQHHD